MKSFYFSLGSVLLILGVALIGPYYGSAESVTTILGIASLLGGIFSFYKFKK